MGTTSTALRAGNCQIGYSLVIEGFEYILTDSGDVGEVVNSYAGTGWSQALPGLEVRGPIRERLEPWARGLSIPTITVRVKQDPLDIFGKAVFKSKPSFNTRLTATFEPSTTGAGTLNVKSTAAAGTDGVLYAGKTRIAYSGKGAGTFTIGAAGWGALQPFTASGANHFGEPAALPGGQNWDAAPPLEVSDVPPTWIGRKVALYLHRIVGDVWDARAQAQLEFAGRISGISDDPNGFTVLECEDLRANVRDAVLLENQWVGYAKKGLRLTAGTIFYAYERYATIVASVYTPADNLSGPFTVVASGAAGDDEINEGVYEYTDIVSALNRWLGNDTLLTAGEWSMEEADHAGYTRIRTKAEFAAGTINAEIALACNRKEGLRFLGYTDATSATGFGLDAQYFVTPPARGTETSLRPELVSPEAPRIASVIRPADYAAASSLISSNYSIEIEASDGVWQNQVGYLPGYLAAYPGSGESWGIVRISDVLFLARYASSTVLDSIVANIGALGDFSLSRNAYGEMTADDGDQSKIAIYQVAILEGSLSSIIPRLFASIDGRGVNHTTYDVLNWGAGIPWQLLGDNFVNSVKALESSSVSNSMTVVLHEPTRLMDVLVPELVLRGAWLMWKGEGYQFVTLATPSALTEDHALTEANKAGSTKTSGSLLATTGITTEWLRNVIKIEYHRSTDGKYQRTLMVRHVTSVAKYGETRALTVSARNSYAYRDQQSKTIEAAAVAMTTRVLPEFSKPLKVIRRTIAPTLFHMVPGDTCTVSDDSVRDPTTGERGISDRGGLVLEVAREFGHEGGELYGECAVLIVDEDRHYPIAPAAEVDTAYTATLGGYTFTNGYDAAGPALKLKDHAYSRSTDALDVTKWAANDLIRMYRMDSTDPAAPDAWSRTISSLDSVNGILVLTATLSAPAYTASASERYRIVPREYSAVQSSQKLSAFQADDADALIEDAAQPNTYGEARWYSYSASAATDLPMLPPTETYGDGKPVHPGIGYDLARLYNNLANYRTAPNMPVLLDQVVITNANIYFPILCYITECGPRPVSGVRYLSVAPFASVNNVLGTASIRVTSSERPPTADTANGFCEFKGTKKQVTFTTAATAYAELAAQDLEPVRRPDGHTTYITVEIKISDVSYQARCHGLSRCYVKAVS